MIEDLECIEEYKQHKSLVTGISVGIGVLIFIAFAVVGVIKVCLQIKAKREKLEK